MGGYDDQRDMFRSIVWAVANGGEDKSMALFLCLRTCLSHGARHLVGLQGAFVHQICLPLDISSSLNWRPR